jgi:asparagine synthase (glutamine-hydrolysing)
MWLGRSHFLILSDDTPNKMCGISGIVRFDNGSADELLLRAMTQAVFHRGPDAEGIYLDGPVGLGHRRLSIIDLSTGHQPMRSADGDLCIVFNGEIYNYLELRAELAGHGARFNTESDTEVILEAYQHWGFSCQDRFNGMWAFAIWDRKEHLLFLSRDRIGEKPLYYTVFGDALLFASEIKSLFAYGVPRAVRRELIEIYLTLGYIPAPDSFYLNIHKLRPGHYLVVSDGRVTERRYWSFPQIDEGDMRVDHDAVCEEFESLLSDSVRLRMRSDVPFGAFLSGGLDSATIVSLMAAHTPHAVETFTIGFEDAAFDERKLALQIARAFHTRHHEYVVRPEVFTESIERTLYHYDEPFGDSSSIPTAHVCRYAAGYVKMVLTGDGGDEVMSGYTVYQGEKFADYYQYLPAMVQRGIPRLVGILGKPFSGGLRYRLNRVATVCDAAGSEFVPRLVNKLAYIRPQRVRQLLTDRNGILPIEDFINDTMRDCRYQDPFYRLMYFQFMVTLPDQMLTKVDRMSMANSLETRIPFLDFRLVELMACVGKRIKMPGFERKHVLRATLGRRLPDALLKAPKRGFSVPLREWFRTDAFDSRLAQLGKADLGLNGTVIRQLVEDNRQGRQDNGNFIWMLVLLDQWMHARPA